MSPDISVIIPAYNAAHFLDRTLTSVYKQSYQPVKLIIVNDGSTDNTLDVIEQWLAKNNPTFEVEVISKANGGLSAARNTGIRAATSTYIALLDADDRYFPEFLQVASCTLTHSNNVDLFFANQKVVNEKDEKIQEWLTIKAITKLAQEPLVDDILLLNEDILPSLVYGNYISCSASVMNREKVLAAGGFDEHIKAAEDLDFYFRFLTNKSIAFTYQELAYVFRHSASISQDKSRYVNINAVHTLLKNKTLLTDKGINLDAIIDHRLQDCFYNASINGMRELKSFAEQVSLVNPKIKPSIKDWLRSMFYSLKN